MNELLSELEAITARLLSASHQLRSGDLAEFNEELRRRGALMLNLNAALKANQPLAYTDYNRLIIIRFNGERIQANLQQVRATIAAALNAGSRDRMYMDRIAAQLPSTSAGA